MLLMHPGPVRAEVRIWVHEVPAVQNGGEDPGLRAACRQVPREPGVHIRLFAQQRDAMYPAVALAGYDACRP